jgi:hypothetical protein
VLQHVAARSAVKAASLAAKDPGLESLTLIADPATGRIVHGAALSVAANLDERVMVGAGANKKKDRKP